METIGSRRWLERTEREWIDRREFNAVKAFRRDSLQEIAAQRPRRWWGGIPIILHDREQRSSLNPKFIAYLDNRLEAHTWGMRLHVAKHQDIQWWSDRLEDIDGSANV